MLLRDVSGHRSVLDLLARALARDTLPPTLLFVGSDGVGKRRVALALAQAINCQSATPAKKGKGGQPLTACGTCESGFWTCDGEGSAICEGDPGEDEIGRAHV